MDSPHELAEELKQKIKLILELETLLSEKDNDLIEKSDALIEKESLRIKADEKARHYEAEYDQLIQSFIAFQRALFGKKSEHVITGTPLPFFEALNKQNDDNKKDDNKKRNEDSEPITRRKRARRPLSTREEIIKADDSERICACGCEK